MNIWKAYKNVKSTSFEMVIWSPAFLSGNIDEVGHDMTSYVFVFAIV